MPLIVQGKDVKAAKLISRLAAPECLTRLQSLEVEKGFSAKLSVMIIGIPNPTVRWFHEDKLIEDSDHYILENDSAQNCYTLIITRITRFQEGTYRCKAENCEGSCSTMGFITVKETRRRKKRRYKPKMSIIQEWKSVEEEECDPEQDKQKLQNRHCWDWWNLGATSDGEGDYKEQEYMERDGSYDSEEEYDDEEMSDDDEYVMLDQTWRPIENEQEQEANGVTKKNREQANGQPTEKNTKQQSDRQSFGNKEQSMPTEQFKTKSEIPNERTSINKVDHHINSSKKEDQPGSTLVNGEPNSQRKDKSTNSDPITKNKSVESHMKPDKMHIEKVQTQKKSTIVDNKALMNYPKDIHAVDSMHSAKAKYVKNTQKIDFNKLPTQPLQRGKSRSLTDLSGGPTHAEIGQELADDRDLATNNYRLIVYLVALCSVLTFCSLYSGTNIRDFMSLTFLFSLVACAIRL